MYWFILFRITSYWNVSYDKSCFSRSHRIVLYCIIYCIISDCLVSYIWLFSNLYFNSISYYIVYYHILSYPIICYIVSYCISSYLILSTYCIVLYCIRNPRCSVTLVAVVLSFMPLFAFSSLSFVGVASRLTLSQASEAAHSSFTDAVQRWRHYKTRQRIYVAGGGRRWVTSVSQSNSGGKKIPPDNDHHHPSQYFAVDIIICQFSWYDPMLYRTASYCNLYLNGQWFRKNGIESYRWVCLSSLPC